MKTPSSPLPTPDSARDAAGWLRCCASLASTASQLLEAAQAGRWSDFIAHGQHYAGLGETLRAGITLVELPEPTQARCAALLQEALALELAARQISGKERDSRLAAVHSTRHSQRLHRSYGALQAEFK